MATKRGTIFKCTSCECELLCMTGCSKADGDDRTPTCCCGEKMEKKCVPMCVS